MAPPQPTAREVHTPIKTVPERLAAAAELFRDRDATYGSNFRSFGPVVEAMFPNGLTLKTARDWNRFGILLQVITKLSRYVASFHKGGHADSLADITNYAAILSLLDDEARAEANPASQRPGGAGLQKMSFEGDAK